MTNEQRGALEQATHEKAMNELGYLPSKKEVDLDRVEKIMYRRSKRCIEFGADWMEQNQWTPVTDQMPRGHYAIRAKLPSQDGNETFHTAFWNGDYFLNGYGREYPPNRSFVTGVLLLQSIDSPHKTTNNG